jgi:flagellar basal body rod protein FlgG
MGVRGTHSPVAVQSLDLSQGALRQTDRPLDVALEGDGFMVVSTKDGQRLTRGGSLAVDANGFLTDRHGDQVLGVDGPLNVKGKKISIATDGTVTVDGARAGKLHLETVADRTKLHKEGEGRFAVDDGATSDPQNLSVHQGNLEDANVDPLLGTVQMIMIQRAYAANIEALHTMDGVMGTITGQIGTP